jgi:hypothetical protein
MFWMKYTLSMQRWSINASTCAQELVLVKGIELQKMFLIGSL